MENRSHLAMLWINIAFLAATDESNGGFIVQIVMTEKRTLNIEDYLKLHGREDLVDWMDYK